MKLLLILIAALLSVQGAVCTIGICGEDEAIWTRTEHTLSNFTVAGINLALYDGKTPQVGHVPDHPPSEPFELYEEFYIRQVEEEEAGKEQNWHNLQRYFKEGNKSPGLQFYNDKVAVKRWLQSRGSDIPRTMVLGYVSDFLKDYDSGDSNITVEELADIILELLPTNETDFVAKPSHMYWSSGVWVVSHDREKAITRVSRNGDEALKELPDFQPYMVAKTLAEKIIEVPSYLDIQPESFKGEMPRPGIVVEERFTAFDRDDEPAMEFKCLVIWGRFYIANWRRGGWRGLWWPGLVKRDGTMVEGSEVERIPLWIDWSRVVGIAEQLGAHKDIFRVDIFVGVPGDSPSLRDDASEMEQLKAARYVVSEMTDISWEPLPPPLMEEMTRLWVAGYKIGNYRVVPNTEVPSDFLARVQEVKELADANFHVDL